MDGKAYIFSVSCGISSVYLHPYLRLDAFEAIDSFYLCGRFSGTLSQTAAELRAQFKKECSLKLKNYYKEKHWFAKLLFSVLAFIATYLFFSIVIRDPLPVIDEFIPASLAACVVYLVLEQISSSPQRHYAVYAKLMEQLDACYIEPSLFVARVETVCASIKNTGDAAELLRGSQRFDMENLDEDEVRAFCVYCSRKWSGAGHLYKLSKKLEDGLPFEKHLKPLFAGYGNGQFALMMAYLYVLRGFLGAGLHV